MRRLISILASVFALLLPLSPKAAEIEEIVVTAEKREGTLQETPIAVTAVTRENLELRNIDDLGQLQFVAPGLVFAELADMAQITMRGVGVDISQMDAEPGVAVYADGTYRGGLTSSASLLFDLERVEVLRGPQGTLFGRNSTGGAVNVISRLPGEANAFEANLIYGDYDRTRVELSGDAVVNPGVFALRGAVAHDARDGYADNNFTGREEDDAESIFAKAAMVFTPSDTVSLIVRAEYTDSEIGGPPFIKTDDHPVPPLGITIENPAGILALPGSCGPVSCVDAFGLDLSPPGIGSDDPRELFSDGDTNFERESFGISAELEIDLSDNLRLKSISSYFDIKQVGDQTNNDGVDITFLTDNFVQTNEEWSQELNLSGTSGNLEWMVGAYYYESDIDQIFEFTLPALQATYEAVFGIFGGGPPLPSGSLAFFGSRLDGSMTPVPFLDFRVTQDLTSVAVFGQGTYNLTDRLRATVGVRWTEDEKEDVQTVVNNLGGDFCRDIELKEDWSETTWRIGLDADLGDNTLLYGSVSTGFKSGGFNGGTCNNPFEPETLLAYEVGTKSRFFDNTLQLNLTAFLYDYEDLQARLFVNNASIVENAADAETYGFEAEWLWLATQALRIDGSVSYLSAEFDDFLSTDPLNPQIGTNCDPVTGLDCVQQLSGNDLLRAPEWKATVSAEYDISLGDNGLLTLRGEYSYTDEMYHTVFNNDFARQDDISLTNLRLIWAPGGELSKFRFIAFVENVSDEEFVVIHAPGATTGGTISQFGPPRTWGLQMRYGASN
ncbi:MAG: TonB-dependent receptor [Pseudomonadota bacterium]